MNTSSRLLSIALALALGAGAAPVLGQTTAAGAPPADPSQGAVPLPALAGWNGALVLDNGDVGVWTVKPYKVFDTYAVPELVGLDDKGRCNILVSYSGKWTPRRTIEEGKWLGGLWHGDLDPRAPGAELYTGGELGNLYQVRAYPYALTDHRLVARFPGREIHTIVGGELDPRSAGPELFVFTRPGALFRVTPTGPDGGFESELLVELPGRVRDALLVPAEYRLPAGALITASRTGRLELVHVDAAGPHFERIHAAGAGQGRLALAPRRAGAGLVLYAGQDDGCVVRHERSPTGDWSHATIYRGPAGTRGVAAGRFDADPDVETVAVFGYSSRVQLLRRVGGKWSAETIFVDRDKGHWLSACEVDGRNATDELVGSGYGGRIFLLQRPPGYGLEDGVPVDPESVDRSAERGAAAAPRIGVHAGAVAAERLDTLDYAGGFETKTGVYETLVQRGPNGELAPALATSWTASDEGRQWTFRLRDGAVWHDGSSVGAADVVAHFRRCAGLPEHAWLRGLGLVTSVTAADAEHVRFELSEPWFLPADLCAINPCGVRAPTTLDREGRFVAPVGSGPLEWLGATEEGRALRYERRDGGGELLLVRLEGLAAGGLEALRDGHLDALVDGWSEALPRERLAELAHTADLELASAPGSSVWYLSFSLEGPSASLDVRRALAAALDRERLVAEAELGHADPCRTWAAPCCTTWPAAATPPPPPPPALASPVRLRLLALDEGREARLARALGAQCAQGSVVLEAQLVTPADYAQRLAAGDYDVRLEHTWGLPYDPDLSLQARFLPAPAAPSAAAPREYGVDPRLRELVSALARTPSDSDRQRLARAIQARLDDAATILPLLAPRRLAMFRPARLQPILGPDAYRIAWR